jgi:localization factor PodJL
MSAAPKRKAPPGLDDLDSQARSAVRKAARHAGMPLEEWLAAVTRSGDGEAEPKPARRSAKRPPPAPADGLDAAVAKLQAVAKLAHKPAGVAADELEEILARAAQETERRSREQAAKTAVALDSVASWIERAETRLSAASRNAAERQDRTAAVLGDALSAMTRRLDEIERKLSDGDRPSIEAALTAIERIEQQLAKPEREPDRGADAAIETVLRGFETRIAEITDRIAPPPPPGGVRAAPADIGSAVAEIRARQAELDEAPESGRPATAPRVPGDILQSLRGDIARLAGQLDTLKPGRGASPEVAGLRSDIERLQAMVGALATRDEVKALEQSLRGIAVQVANARQPGDLAAVARPVEELQSEVRRVADLVATGVHARLSRDFEGLARRIDAVAEMGLDPAVVDGLAQQLLDLRHHLADLAEPQRVHQLATQVAELNDRLAEMGRRQVDTKEFERRFDGLSRKLDSLSDLRTQPASDIAERIEALSQKLDRLGEKPRITFAAPAEGVDSLVQRLDRLDEALTRGGPAPQHKPIEDMLRTLVERIEQAGRPGAGLESLDALEKQVGILARRLERGSGDPALAALERTMGDLMAQVELMRTDACDAAERAAKAAVADTLAALPKGASALAPEDEPELGLIRRDLDDLKTHRSASEKRMQMTLESVHAALEKVVSRLGTLGPEGLPEAVPDEAAPRPAGERPQTVRVKVPTPAMRTGEAAAEVALTEADRPIPPAGEEVLLEPGAARPRPNGAAPASPAAPNAGVDIKASFIAAARRAAQAAAAEAAANKAKPGKGAARDGSLLSRADGAKASLAARMRGSLDKHRRPVLLGLAAIVLVLGAIQAVGMLGGSQPAPKPEARIAAPAPVSAMDQGRAAPEAAPSELADPGTEPKPDEPRTTQAISTSAVSAPAVSTPAAPGKPEPAAPALKPDERTVTALPAKADPRAPMTLPGSAPAPLQLAPAAPALTGAIDPRPAPEKIANVGAVGDIPTATGLTGLRQAALAGDPAAVYELAARLAEGRGIARDLRLAAKLFEKAAANGLVPAQYRIGNHYEKGLGVTRDIPLAKAWYERAAEKGNARAMHNLAVLLAEGGADGKPDYAAAAESFRKAAEHGIKDSQFNLAVLLARGLGVSQNLARSYTWFAIVAAQGDDDAAKKRDEVGQRLSAADLATAKAAAETFRPTAPVRETNEVALPPQGWPEPAAGTAPKAPTPSAQRPGGAGKRV